MGFNFLFTGYEKKV